jgi:4-amino-4-deoxy-L-arabinose transferase-like glycosyltransferase
LLLALGIGLRVRLIAAQDPAFIGIGDSTSYIAAAQHNVFRHAALHQWPAGYPAFLRLVHALAPSLWLTVLIQHLLGLGTALLLFLTVRCVAPPLWGLLPAGIVLLAGPQLFLEHAVMSEAPFTFLIAAFTYSTVRAREGQALLWGALAGALAAAAACVRTVGTPFVAVVVVWLLATTPGSFRQRLPGALAVVLSACLVFGAYLVEMKRETGFGGPKLTRKGDWGAPTAARDVNRVTSDLTHFWTSTRPRPYDTGFSYEILVAAMRTPNVDQLRYTKRFYSTAVPVFRTSQLAAMRSYERHTRLEGLPFLGLVLLALAGIPFARGPRLAVALLTLAVALVTLVAPIVYVWFDARYVVPGYGLLAMAAALGAVSLWERIAAWRAASMRARARPALRARVRV